MILRNACRNLAARRARRMRQRIMPPHARSARAKRPRAATLLPHPNSPLARARPATTSPYQRDESRSREGEHYSARHPETREEPGRYGGVKGKVRIVTRGG